MQLNERKLKILQAIIQDYIETAEPVGSRTLSKKYDLGISPATIRNEMSDLEDLGFIMQPHTSAGRVPSDKGYRLYVDQFMTFKNMADFQKKQVKLNLLRKFGEIEQLLQYSTKLLSQLTNYTAVALTPQVQESKLKHIQLVPLDGENILSVIITDNGVVKKPLLRLSSEVDEEDLQIISNWINHKLQGLTIKDIESTLISQIDREVVQFNSIIEELIPEIFQSLDEADDIEIFLNGTMNIFNFPEFNDIFKAKSFLTLLEEKQLLSSMITSFNNKGLTISIGSENVCQEAKECSLVTATCKVDDATVGWLSVIGPTRMDYSTVVSVVAQISSYINELLKERYK